jgi:hypothetical protein
MSSAAFDARKIAGLPIALALAVPRTSRLAEGEQEESSALVVIGAVFFTVANGCP